MAPRTSSAVQPAAPTPSLGNFGSGTAAGATRTRRRSPRVNDIHSRLNATTVERILYPESVEAVARIVRRARRQRKAICVAGGRHAMGGQQFAHGALLVDTRRLDRVLDLDQERGTIEVEAGIQWPALIRYLLAAQEGRDRQWGIAQKQTGADHFSLGGSLAANIHGRGLRMRPMIGDVESFVLVDTEGTPRSCSREENPDIFRLAIGGYGLFGIITSVKLRLTPRRKLRRQVQVIRSTELVPAFEQRIAAGHLYGDFQFVTDERSGGFLREGIFSTYAPVDADTPMPPAQRELSADEWRDLLCLAHADKREAYARYAAHYLATSGQLYWSDTHQLSVYLDDYHRELDARLGCREWGSEMITEMYVPRSALTGFLEEAREDFRRTGVNLIYGTVRLIERDEESLLAWAREPFACIVFNLHVTHTPAGVAHAAAAFRRLIDLAIRRGGSFYLTYHRYATRAQVEACYPQFAEFLRLKRKCDPEERFQSEWYRHYRALFERGAE
ncbi:MAG: FAD-binding oxidoreductase [Gemmatimonadota bacterium]|nr:FAD-binding oxidoreductase [Gemmatimonadota bacterium]